MRRFLPRLTCTVLLLAGCGSDHEGPTAPPPPPPTPPGLSITTRTTGFTLDRDGYDVQVGNADSLHLLPTDSAGLEPLAPGTYAVRVTGIAPNCQRVLPASDSVTIEPGRQTLLALQIQCDSAWHDVILFTRIHVASLKPAEIYRIRPDGTDEVRIGTGADPTVSPDGEVLIYSKSGVLWQVRVDGSGGRALPAGFSAYRPRWSPNGQEIVFMSYATGTYKTFLATPEGAQVRELTTSLDAEDGPIWSSDGQHIAFTRFPASGGSEIVVVDRDGLHEERPVGVPYRGHACDWHPKQDQILTSEGDLAVVQISSGLISPLAHDSVFEGCGAWSPTGDQAAFYREAELNTLYPMYRVAADGAGLTQVTHPSTDALDLPVQWLPPR